MSDAPIEREAKLAVDDAYVFPDLSAIPGVTVVDEGVTTLHAVYWDTAELTLARGGVGLRHRNGTWTFKGPTRRDGDSVVREEREVIASAESVPVQLHDAVLRRAPLAALRPTADVVTDRHTRVVTRGEESAETVDDIVTVRDGEGAVVSRWRALEVEHEEASVPLATEVVAMLVDAGARADHDSKYVRALRALGHDVTGVTDA